MDYIDSLKVLAGGRPRRHGTNVHSVTATAVSDSADGHVLVDMGGTVVSGDGSQHVDVPTTVDVREGDTVSVQLVGADDSAKTMTVTGVVGGGDRTMADVDDARRTATDYLGDDGTATTVGRPTGTGARLGIGESSVEVLDADGVSLAEYGETSRVGRMESAHVTTTESETRYEDGDVMLARITSRNDEGGALGYTVFESGQQLILRAADGKPVAMTAPRDPDGYSSDIGISILPYVSDAAGTVSYKAEVVGGLLEYNYRPCFARAQCSGADGNWFGLAAGTITQVPLVAPKLVTTNNSWAQGAGRRLFEVHDGGIRVNHTGLLLVTSSCYVLPNVTTAQRGAVGTYVMRGSSYQSSVEVLGYLAGSPYASGSQAATGPKLVQCTSGDVFYLAARCTEVAGTCRADNPATYLLLEIAG